MIRPTLIDMNPDEIHYYLFTVLLANRNWSCNTAEGRFGRIGVPSKIEDKNLKVFNMIKRINKWKHL